MILAHELGHAGLALCFARGVVQVHVGRPPGLIRVGRRLKIAFSPEPTRGVSYGGVTIFNARGITSVQALAILAAGPAVTGLATIALAAGSLWAASEAPLLALVLGLSAVEALFSVAWNLRTRPLPPGEERAHVDQPDGVKIAQAWRAHRGMKAAPPKRRTAQAQMPRRTTATPNPNQHPRLRTDTSGSEPPPTKQSDSRFAIKSSSARAVWGFVVLLGTAAVWLVAVGASPRLLVLFTVIAIWTPLLNRSTRQRETNASHPHPAPSTNDQTPGSTDSTFADTTSRGGQRDRSVPPPGN